MNPFLIALLFVFFSVNTSFSAAAGEGKGMVLPGEVDDGAGGTPLSSSTPVTPLSASPRLHLAAAAGTSPTAPATASSDGARALPRLPLTAASTAEDDGSVIRTPSAASSTATAGRYHAHASSVSDILRSATPSHSASGEGGLPAVALAGFENTDPNRSKTVDRDTANYGANDGSVVSASTRGDAPLGDETTIAADAGQHDHAAATPAQPLPAAAGGATFGGPAVGAAAAPDKGLFDQFLENCCCCLSCLWKKR